MESEFDQHLILRMARSAGKAINALEGLLCMFFGSLILLLGGAAVAVAAVNWEQFRKTSCWLTAAAIVGATGWLALDLPYMFRLMLLAIRGQHPVALIGAMRQKMPPKVLRPVLATWWGAHFLIAGLVAAMAHAISNQGSNFQTESNPASHWLMPAWFVLCGVAVGFAANGFLILSVYSATPSASIRAKVWRFRLLIDFAIALLGFVLSLFVPKQ